MTSNTGAVEVRRSQSDRSTVIIVLLCTAAFMAMLDVFVVNVAFTAIGQDFNGSSLPDLSWILNAYTVVYAALLIPAGRLADRHGRKAGFLIGLGIFTAASAACAACPTLWWLIGCRVVQAAGAAALTPASLGLLLTVIPAERRAGAVKVWATTSSLAAAVGPVVGGALVQLSWQWVFLINVPVGVLAFVGTLWLVSDSRDESATRIPDVLGTVVLAAAIGAVALALVKGSDWGWSDVRTLGAFVIAVAAAALFVARILRHPAPAVDPALLRIRSFAWANITVLLFSVAFGALFPSVILWLENSGQYSAIRTGLATAPGPLMVPIFAMVAQRISSRMPVGALVAVGNLLFAAGAAMLAGSAHAPVHYATQILPGWLVIGVGIGLALPSLLATATSELPPAQAATGSAVINTSRQLGYVLGVSVLVVIIGSTTLSADAAATSFAHAWWAIVVIVVASAAAALGITPSARR